MEKFYRRLFFLFLALGLFSISVAALAASSYYLDGSITPQPQFLRDADIAVIDESGVDVVNGGILFMQDFKVTQELLTTMIEGAVMAESGSTIKLNNVQVSTEGTLVSAGPPAVVYGANGIFATGPGSMITLNNVDIYCGTYAARGIYTKNSGTIIANNVNVETWKGGGGAAIATSGDHGGTIEVNGGTFTSHAGMGSAAVFSTGNITVNNAILTAEVAEGAVVDGSSFITFNNTILSALANCGVAASKSPFSFISDGTSQFTMNGGKLTSYGPLFYVPNSYAVIKVQKAKLKSDSGVLINTILPDGGPGSDPARPAKLNFSAKDQFLEGDVICGSDTTTTLKLERRTILTGAINNSDASGAIVILELDKTSKWNVTADSYITVLVSGGGRHGKLNIHCLKGVTVYYNSDANDWLGGKTYKLHGGGMLTPY